MDVEAVVKALENMVAGKGIDFDTLRIVLTELRLFTDDGLSYQFYEWMNDNHTEEYDERFNKLGDDIRGFDTGTIYEIVHRFGGEGEGDSWDQVIEHKASGRFMQCEGYYASYHGFDTDGCEYIEVKPVPVTVIEYHLI